MYDIGNFGLAEMVELGSRVRALGLAAASMEGVAERIVRTLHEGFGVGDTYRGPRTFSLARFYKSHPYGLLPTELKQFANGLEPGEALDPRTRCLTMLATRGFEEGWRSRARSVGHQAMPLCRPDSLDRVPLIAALVRQLGQDPARIAKPDPMTDSDTNTCGVHYVPEAPGSAFVRSQKDFVERYRIQSALSFGGFLPGGDLFAVVLFSASPVGHEAADLFRILALSVKMAILPFTGRVFS